MPAPLMTLKVLLPSQVLIEKAGVSRIVAETHDGAYGLLPRRRDCVATLAPGILTYETAEDGEVYVAVDEGILVKAGPDVLVSVRRATAGSDLASLKETVEHEFLTIDDAERDVRLVLAKLETGLLRRMAGFHHE